MVGNEVGRVARLQRFGKLAACAGLEHAQRLGGKREAACAHDRERGSVGARISGAGPARHRLRAALGNIDRDQRHRAPHACAMERAGEAASFELREVRADQVHLLDGNAAAQERIVGREQVREGQARNLRERRAAAREEEQRNVARPQSARGAQERLACGDRSFVWQRVSTHHRAGNFGRTGRHCQNRGQWSQRIARALHQLGGDLAHAQHEAPAARQRLGNDEPLAFSRERAQAGLPREAPRSEGVDHLVVERDELCARVHVQEPTPRARSRVRGACGRV